MITNYHYAILLFNLLPIFPLDGSKIINLSLNKILPFKLSHKISLYISYIGLFFLLYMTRYINFNTNFYLLLVLLLTKIIEEGKNHESIFNKFLLERYLYDFHFSKLKIIKGKLLDKMMHSKNHLFKIDEKLKTEKEVLKTRYQKDKPNLH
jgi:stage IV sporulation protein FB